MKIIIIFDNPGSGEISPDHADVLYQAQSVRKTLTALGHECSELGITLDLDRFIAEIKEMAPDLVFNLVESISGKGSLIHIAPSILDSLGIPYTGSNTDGIYRTSNKLFAKEWLKANSIPTPDYFSLEDYNKGNIRISGDYIIKSVWEHASIGLDDQSIIAPESVKELINEMARRKNLLGGNCFAEKYIEGREFNLSMLADSNGPEVLPPAEIQFNSYNEGKRKIVGYEAKWDQDSFEYNNTVRSFDFHDDDKHLLQHLKELSIRCWKSFNIRGYCRVDFRVDENNQPWVLEINANPCISPDAGFMAAAACAGLKAEEVTKRIVDDSDVII
jgi:D-alanine-D-alanine ligase